MKSKNELLTLAVLAMTATGVTVGEVARAAPKKGAKSVECFGVNGCSGQNGCGVGQDQIDLANKTFENRFSKSKTMDCAGNADGSAKAGYLAWVKKDSKDDCVKAKGFVFEKDAKGKLTIVSK